MFRPFNDFVHGALKGIDPLDYTPQQRVIAAEWVARQSFKDNQARAAAFRKRFKHAKGRDRLSIIASMAIMANGIRAISYPRTLTDSLKRSTRSTRRNPTAKGSKKSKSKTGPGPAIAPSGPPTPADEHVLITKCKVARTHLLFMMPFFGFIISSMPDVLDDKLSTAATDGKRILWNARFLASLDRDALEFVMGHEAMHCVLQHLWRKGKRNHKAFNIAADAVVNDMLVDGGLKEPKLDFPVIRGSNVISLWTDGKVSGPNMSGKSMEEIYDELIKLQEEGKGPAPAPPPGPGGYPGGGGGGEEEGESGNPGGTLDDHREWEDAEKKPGAEGASDYWKAQAASAKHFGKVPGGIARHLEEVLYPKADWRQLLSQGMYFPIDYDWYHMDKRLMASGILIPGLHGERHRAVFIIDTSGSMSGEQLSEFWAEISYIARQNDIDLRVITADVEVQNEWMEGEFSPDLIKMVRGGGGTSFVHSLNRVAEYGQYGWIPEIVVYLTDLAGQFPSSAPDFRVIWGVSKRDEKMEYPFGEMIVIE